MGLNIMFLIVIAHIKIIRQVWSSKGRTVKNIPNYIHRQIK